MIKLTRNYSTGFTLIELLIAIAILGILTASLLANYTISQKRARDSQRKHDLKQIQTALEMYFQDNDIYPPSLEFGAALTSDDGIVYMQKIPQDTKSDRKYFYTQDNPQNFKLYACLENKDDDAIDDSYSDTDCGLACGTNCNYGISSPNTNP